MDKKNSQDSFSPAVPAIMHIDLNSCFATVEQQANPRLRGKPVAVAAYTTGNGCILAPSIEAKRFGVKTGMRVRDGNALCPGLIILPSDPWKYRFVNRKLLALLRQYTADVEVRSIDEMVMDLEKSPALFRLLSFPSRDETRGKLQRESSPYLKLDPRVRPEDDKPYKLATLVIGEEIKKRIKDEIGEWLTVSIGIAPNRFLAKTAAGLHKPDGLDVIDRENVEEVLFAMKLEDLCGIKKGNGGRLMASGIMTTRDFYRASPEQLEATFHSIVGRHWWMRLHGHEIDNREFDRKSFGHSYALYKPYRPSEKAFAQILDQLVEKMGRRMRAGGYTAQGVHVSCFYSDHSFWHHGHKLAQPIYANRDLYHGAQRILSHAPDKPVRIASVSCFALSPVLYGQQSILEDEWRKERLTKAIDVLADRWGDFVVTSGRMLSMETKILDRIAFGGVSGLEELVFHDPVDHAYLPD